MGEFKKERNVVKKINKRKKNSVMFMFKPLKNYKDKKNKTKG